MDETLIFSLSEQEVMAAYLLFTYIEHEVEFKWQMASFCCIPKIMVE